MMTWQWWWQWQCGPGICACTKLVVCTLSLVWLQFHKNLLNNLHVQLNFTFPILLLASEYQLNYPASGPKLYVHCLETYIRLNTNISQGLLWGKLDIMYLYNIWIDGYNKSSFFVACVFTIFPWICSWTYCNDKNVGVSAYFTEVTHVGAYYKIQYCIKILC